MNNVCIILIFLQLHLLADFYLQTAKMAEQIKETSDESKIFTKSKTSFLIHILIYSGLMLIPFFVFGFNWWYLLIGVICGVSHCIIDILKILFRKKFKYDSIVFVIDQVVHIFVIIISTYFLSSKNTNALWNLEQYLDKNIIQWITSIIFLWKPANIIFKNLFSKYKPNKNNQEKDDNSFENTLNDDIGKDNAGAMIGNMERLLLFVCLFFGQYITMGLIITCKGFARYATIQKNASFAEYFLIGTFYSIIYVVCIYTAFFILI